MARPRRIRQKLKWIGSILSITIVAGWFFSICAWALYSRRLADGVMTVTLSLGCIDCVRTHAPRFDPNSYEYWKWYGFGWSSGRSNPRWPQWGCRFRRYSAFDLGNRDVQVIVPLWMPFLIVAIPTAYLWWRDRRQIPAGHCRKCGYNLTGNVSGVCPECGEPV
jgi:hypothetical protein